jgi:trehalose utilization protein
MKTLDKISNWIFPYVEYEECREKIVHREAIHPWGSELYFKYWLEGGETFKSITFFEIGSDHITYKPKL